MSLTFYTRRSKLSRQYHYHPLPFMGDAQVNLLATWLGDELAQGI